MRINKYLAFALISSKAVAMLTDDESGSLALSDGSSHVSDDDGA